jgi:Flp pilus assembly protein TadD
MQRYATYLITGQRPYRKLPIQERRPILKLEPGEPWARARQATEMAEEGRCVQARSEIRRAQQLVQAENMRMLALVGTVYWHCGERNRARSLLAAMKRRPDVRDHGSRIASLHTLFGEKDSAFAWLERHRWTMPQLAGLRADLQLEPLRSDPRFTQLLRRLGALSS